jgi:hypothetical protein
VAIYCIHFERPFSGLFGITAYIVNSLKDTGFFSSAYKCIENIRRIDMKRIMVTDESYGEAFFEKTEEGILFGSVLTNDVFKSVDMSNILSSQLMSITITAILGQLGSISRNTDYEFAEALFDECLASIEEMREIVLSEYDSMENEKH